MHGHGGVLRPPEISHNRGARSATPRYHPRTMQTVALFLAATAFVASCGGDGGSCGKVPACGGDVNGTWRYEAFCGELAALAFPLLPCPQAKTISSRSSRSGTLTLGADGSFEENGAMTSTFSLEVPAFCLPDGVSCESFGDSFKVMIVPIDSMTCSPSASGCRCTEVLSATAAVSGTATVEGTTLTLSSPGHLPSELSYCVQGDELHLDRIVTPLATGKPELELGIVARKQ
jgi:hypothetical protein